MNTINDLGVYIPTYSQLLDKISHYAIGSEFSVGYLEYDSNRKLYEKAIEDGYILHNIKGYTARFFLVVKLPIKELDEDLINSYYL